MKKFWIAHEVHVRTQHVEHNGKVLDKLTLYAEEMTTEEWGVEITRRVLNHEGLHNMFSTDDESEEVKIW